MSESKTVLPIEQLRHYPVEWESEYKSTSRVKLWRNDFPDQFEDWMGSTRPKSLELFAQYALMYLLRRDDGMQSITWYKLCDDPWRSKNQDRTLGYWNVMRRALGQQTFERLQTSLKSCGYGTFKGEPDLFCWHPDSKEWFFAEAKRKDKLTESQIDWIRVYRSVLVDSPDIRLYRLVAKK